jgi:hypothetical protein
LLELSGPKPGELTWIPSIVKVLTLKGATEGAAPLPPPPPPPPPEKLGKVPVTWMEVRVSAPAALLTPFCLEIEVRVVEEKVVSPELEDR